MPSNCFYFIFLTHTRKKYQIALVIFQYNFQLKQLYSLYIFFILLPFLQIVLHWKKIVLEEEPVGTKQNCHISEFGI